MINDESEIDLAARYLENVLGVGSVATDFNHVPKGADSRARCLLIDVSDGQPSPSLREMSTKLLEALHTEWNKHSGSLDPEMKWIQADQSSWASLLAMNSDGIVLAIVCGAQKFPAESSHVLHVSSLVEMQASHIVKREAWHAMQRSIALRHASTLGLT